MPMPCIKSREPALPRSGRPLTHAPLALALTTALGVASVAGHAATITVTDGGDAGTPASCTLRQAITSMNDGVVSGACTASGSFGNNDTIDFATGPFPVDGSSRITLSQGQLLVSDSKLTIDASANDTVTVDADQGSRVLKDTAGPGGALVLSHVTLTNGKVTTDDCYSSNQGGGICLKEADLALQHSTISNSSASWGGGVYARSGNITLLDSTVSGNFADTGGGGVYNHTGDVTLIDSTVSHNVAYLGGGIADVEGNVTLTNSIVSHNVAALVAGGIADTIGHVALTRSTVSGNAAKTGGGIVVAGDLVLTNSTVSDNFAAEKGGAIATTYGSITLTNSTVSRNSAIQAGNALYIQNNGVVDARNTIIAGNTGGGHDLDGVTPSGSHNLIGGDPLLGPLTDNGGPTQTMLPKPGSPALDAGDITRCPAADQRGVARPQGARCDIGAVEAIVVDHLQPLFGGGQTAVLWHAFGFPLGVQVSGAHALPAPGVKLQVTTPSGGSQASATCTGGVTNSAGIAYLYCRANGVPGTYTVKVGSPSSLAQPVAFTLTNVDDNDTIFRDGFDPPGPTLR